MERTDSELAFTPGVLFDVGAPPSFVQMPSMGIAPDFLPSEATPTPSQHAPTFALPLPEGDTIMASTDAVILPEQIRRTGTNMQRLTVSEGSVQRERSAKSGQGGRQAGFKNYSDLELTKLLDIVEDVEPLGSNH